MVKSIALNAFTIDVLKINYIVKYTPVVNYILMAFALVVMLLYISAPCVNKLIINCI